MSGHFVITEHTVILNIATINIYRICGDAEETSMDSSYFTERVGELYHESNPAPSVLKSSALITDQS